MIFAADKVSKVGELRTVLSEAARRHEPRAESLVPHAGLLISGIASGCSRNDLATPRSSTSWAPRWPDSTTI